jgi:homoserine dehydrogenase
VRIWLVGTGMVGRWLLSVFANRAAELERRYAFTPKLVGVSNAQHGFVHSADGIDPGELLRGLERGQGLATVGEVEHLDSALAGMRASEADLLIEVSRSRRLDGEPGASHMREAIRRRIAVATSNKWPVALHGVELKRLASEAGIGFRAESTVMSGTPLLSFLLEGLAGARPLELRGVLNATANLIATRIGEGVTYEQALREAQRAGVAEADPGEDVEGWDAVAKLMILAALVFGRQLASDEVERRGIDELRTAEPGGRAGSRTVVRPVESLVAAEEGTLVARTAPEELDPDDPLAAVTGLGNAVICRCDPLGEVVLTGPGAGPALAGQGVLSDAIALAGSRR